MIEPMLFVPKVQPAKGFKLSPGPGVRFGVPPRELLEPMIDADPADRGGHWYWKGDENKWREATFLWRQQGVHTPSGSYLVARVLYHHDIAPVPEHSSLRSLCSLPWCINPHHWQLYTREDRASAHGNSR